MNILIHPTYFPSISHFAAMVHSENITFEVEDNFQKQTNRNRTYIYSPNGIQLLNIPIKHSGWKSNWELSAARATNVLHYMIDECSMEPQKMSAIGYGEYRPIDTNDTKEGRANNRRVEIIILPKEMTKKSYEEAQVRMSDEAKAAEESKPVATQEEAVK